MGEAKRRERAERRWSAQWAPSGDLPVLRMVLVRVGPGSESGLARLLEQVGDVPLLREALRQAQQAAASSFIWHRAPTGREWVEALPTSCDVDSALDVKACWAFDRAWSARALMLEEQGALRCDPCWAQEWDARASSLATVHDMLEVKPAKDLWHQPAEQWALHTDVAKGSVDAGAVARAVVALLERRVADAASAADVAGKVSLTFEGLDRDEREVWEIDACRAVVQRVAAAAPWWPWLVQRTQAFMWLACLVPHKRTVRLIDGELLLDCDAQAMQSAISQAVGAALNLVAELGMDEEKLRHGAAHVLGPLVRFEEHHRERWAALQQGKLQEASEPVTLSIAQLRAKFEGQAARQRGEENSPVPEFGLEQALAESGGAGKAFGLMVDRSTEGRRGLEQLARSKAWPAALLQGAGMQAWQAGTAPFLLVWGTPTGRMASIPCENLVELCGPAIGHCLGRQNAEGVSTAWAVCMEPVAAAAVRDELMAFCEAVGA